MDTIAACGDVNRNVMCNPNPYLSEVHAEVLKVGAGHLATTSRRRPAPITRSGCDGEKIEVQPRRRSSRSTARPICRGSSRSPSPCRRRNDVDIYANCLSFIAIVEDGKLVGYNVAVGGGMGSTHGNEETYPRIADVIGFCTPEQVVDVAEKVVLVQRDFGDRTDRKHSRFKYTVDDHGPDWILAKLNEYLGYKLGPVRDVQVRRQRRPLRLGRGRERQLAPHALHPGRPRARHAGLSAAAPACARSRRSTTATSASPRTRTSSSPTSRPRKRPEIETLLEQYGIKDSHLKSALRLNSLACVALPTCGLSPRPKPSATCPISSPSSRKSSRKTACATTPSPSA